jgi:N-ethylmaleimide reductase
MSTLPLSEAPAVHALFSPVQVGPYALTHRVVAAPLTRLRSEAGDVPGEMMLEYYTQRASAGSLTIAESTGVSIVGRSYLGAPGIYSDAQVVGWRNITDAVHAKGGRIFLQLFHGGRQSNVGMTGGATPIAPSVRPFEGVAMTAEGWVPVSPHRALALEEIPGLIAEFRQAGERALAAGFDGVELHGANGYLPDQFLQDSSNHRTDVYGGPVENRARLLLELTQALVDVWGADRVGVRLSPSGQWGAMADSNPDATFAYVATQLNAFGLAYLHLVEPRIKGDDTLVEGGAPVAAARLRKLFTGPIIAAGGFDRAGADAIIARGDADLVAFGRVFASNPDLPERLKLGVPLAPYDRSAFWGGDRRGYTDYPTYQEQLALVPA